jgi:CubicO group peptidase (beta-lactamase class C family)
MKIKLSFFYFLLTLGSAIGQDYETSANATIHAAVGNGSVVGISAGFSIAGEVKWTGAAGYSDQEQKIKFTSSTLNRIASISKPLTAVAIMQLYEAGKIDLDAPIQNYLKDFPVKEEGDITVRQLLNHSAGIDDYKNKKEMENQQYYPSLEDAMAVFQDRDLIFTPGQSFYYTTYGYVVLGRVIEEVSGVSYEEFIQTNILDPLNMTNTGIEYANIDYPNKAELYHKNEKGKTEVADHHDLSNRVPGGGFYSTVGDMLKFGDAVIQNTLISEATKEIMFADSGLKKEGNGYGLGWYLYGENPNYGPVYGHNGAQTGASAFLMLLPQEETSIIVLSNTSGAMQEVSNMMIALFDVAAMAKR